jgi:ADP-ribose diphosphatase
VRKYFAIRRDINDVEFVHLKGGNEVIVVALTESDEIILISEPSPAFGGQVLVLPGGSTSPGETLAETANRELQEEAGVKAARLDVIGNLAPFSKYLAVRSSVLLARELTASRLPRDEPYEIAKRLVPLDRFEDLVTAGEVDDARVVASLFLARAFLSREVRG